MRLYKLISRHGQKKRRLWPWFKPPAPEQPMSYAGWFWNPEIGEWDKTQTERITVEVQVPKFTKPEQPPRPAQPLNVPGWYWNGRLKRWEEIPLIPQELSEGIERGPMPTRMPGPADPNKVEGWSWSTKTDEWVATIIFGQRIEFMPPHSFHPQVELAVVNMVYPMTEQYALFYQNLISAGLDPHEAERIGKIMVEGFWQMSRSAAQKQRAADYAFSMTQIAHRQSDAVETFGVYAVMILVATITGLLIGNILERMTFVDEDDFMLVESEGTYLLGPDHWEYSRLIGKSIRERTFYSHCEDIGTEYFRHKRQRGKIGFDVIDFPGGFLETGYQFPYYVKFLWSHWVVQYIGMLESRSEGFYELKKADINGYASVRPGWSAKLSDWCRDFQYYL